jgi:hypothetical protein
MRLVLREKAVPSSPASRAAFFLMPTYAWATGESDMTLRMTPDAASYLLLLQTQPRPLAGLFVPDVPLALQRIAAVSGNKSLVRGGRSNSPGVKSGDHGNSHFLLTLE